MSPSWKSISIHECKAKAKRVIITDNQRCDESGPCEHECKFKSNGRLSLPTKYARVGKVIINSHGGLALDCRAGSSMSRKTYHKIINARNELKSNNRHDIGKEVGVHSCTVRDALRIERELQEVGVEI